MNDKGCNLAVTPFFLLSFSQKNFIFLHLASFCCANFTFAFHSIADELPLQCRRANHPTTWRPTTSDREDERLKRNGAKTMQEKNVLDAFKSLLTPLIKEVVLTTIEEHQQAQQQTEIYEDAEVTPKEAARQLGVSITTLWRWNNNGYLIPVRIGRKTCYRQSDINAIKQGRAAR